MHNLILKDLYIQKKSLLIALLYIVLFMVVYRNLESMMFTGASVAFSYILITGAFAIDDKNKADIMLNCLPVKRSQIVMAKYITLFVFMIMGALFYSTVYAAITLAQVPITIYPINLTALTGSFVALGIINAIFLPIIFKVGYTKSRIFHFLLFFVFFFGLPALVNWVKVRQESAFSQIAVDILNNQSDVTISIAFVVLTLLILCFSFFLSLKFYAKREF